MSTDSPHGAPHRTASKLAQLLGETLVHHAPWSAKIQDAEKWRGIENFLEGLESHTQGQLAPLLIKLRDMTDWPEELKPLLDEAIEPPEQFSAFLEQVFLYGVVSNL